MRKLALCSVLFITILALPQGISSPSFPMQDVRVQEFHVFDYFMLQPPEVLLIFFKDGTVYAFTTNDEYRVAIEAHLLISWLDNKGHPIEGALLIIHSHPNPAPFSQEDMGVYYILRHHGFRGYYAIYYPFSGKTKYLEKGNASSKEKQ